MYKTLILIFTKKVNFDDVDPNYVIRDVNSLISEFEVNRELIFDENFVNLVMNAEILHKSILVEDNTPVYDMENILDLGIPILKFGKFFSTLYEFWEILL